MTERVGECQLGDRRIEACTGSKTNRKELSEMNNLPTMTERTETRKTNE